VRWSRREKQLEPGKLVDWFSLGALPIGLIFFAGTALRVLRRRAGHVSAREEYPAIASELGLTYRASRYATGVGTLTGSIDGFKLVVDPDEQRRIWLTWSISPGLIFHHRPDTRRPPPGYAAIRVKNQRVASFFSTSLATPEGARSLGDGGPLEAFVLTLRELGGLKDASVSDAGISLTFDFGSPPFIPAGVVRASVPALVGLARALSPR